MSKSTWWRLKHYFWLSMLTLALFALIATVSFVFIVVLLRLALHSSLKELGKGDVGVIVAIISFVVPLLLGGISIYTNYRSQLSYLVASSLRDLRSGEYESVKQHYRDYLRLPMHVIWPSQRMEFYKAMAEVVPQIDCLLAAERLGEAIEYLNHLSIPLEVITNTLTLLEIERLLLSDANTRGGYDCSEYLQKLFAPFLRRVPWIESLKLQQELSAEEGTCREKAETGLKQLLLPRIRKLLPPLKEGGVIPSEVATGRLAWPMNLVIPPIKVPLSAELQSKTLRLYLNYLLKPEQADEVREWAGKQNRSEYEMEIAWSKVGLSRPIRVPATYIAEEVIKKLYSLECMPFHTDGGFDNKFTVFPNYPGNLPGLLKGEKHHIIFGGPGSGKTWLARYLEEELLKGNYNVYSYNFTLGYEAFTDNLISSIQIDGNTFLIISEVEELIKEGVSPKVTWKILSRMMWDKNIFGRDGLFVKLILPSELETYVRNSISAVRTPVDVIKLEWNNEDLKRLWEHRIASCSNSVGRDYHSILEFVGEGPLPSAFRLKKTWKHSETKERLTEGVDEFLISLACGSPKCLVALGRRFLEYAAYRKLQEKDDPEATVYRSLAMLLEAYYAQRADPIPECQDVVRKTSGT